MNKNLVRIDYDHKKDEFQLLISTDGGEEWGFSFGTKCQQRKGNGQDAEPMYIHCQIIDELKRAILNGFEVVY